MARYIDADIALKKMNNWHTQERLMDCVRNTPTADVAPKSEVARDIFAEIEEALQYEKDLEDKNGRNAWGNGDTVGFHIHNYAEDKLDTLLIALSLLKKKYTEGEK